MSDFFSNGASSKESVFRRNHFKYISNFTYSAITIFFRVPQLRNAALREHSQFQLFGEAEVDFEWFGDGAH